MEGSDRMFDRRAVDAAFARHEKVAFAFSGGKDSTAALHLLRDYWDRMTVYWCAGDPLPALREHVERTAAGLRFVEVDGRLRDNVAQHGLPSDIVPFDCTEMAHALGVGSGVLLQERYACCWRTLMAPLYSAMKQDGMTLIIRGQKDSDTLKGPHRSGDVGDGVELLFPIEAWTDDNVFAYLRLMGVAIPDYYGAGMQHSFDCAACTAWLHEPRGAYLRANHPGKFEEFRANLAIVAGAAEVAVNNLIAEVEECNVAQDR